MYLSSDPVDVLDLPGVCGNPASALHDQQDRRGGDHHHPLPIFPGTLPSPLPHQLDMALLLRGILRHDRYRCWGGADYSVLRLLLFVCNKR